jgi:hypothetical protein
MLSTSEGREGRFMAWRGGRGRGGERDIITAMKKEKQTCGNGNRTYCETNKGLVYESVWHRVPVQVGNGTTRRHGTVLGRTKKRN